MNNNTGLLRTVVVFLGLITLAVVVGAFVLAYHGDDIPAALIGLGGTSLGALGGILTNTVAGSSSSAATSTAESAVAAAVPDFGPIRDQLGAAAQTLVDLAKGLENPAAGTPAAPVAVAPEPAQP